MDPHTLAVTLAIAAGWLSFNSLIVGAYFLLNRKATLEAGWKMAEWLKLGRRPSPVVGRGTLPSQSPLADIQVNTSSTLPERGDSAEEATPEKDEADDYSGAHVLFVMYGQPNSAINKKLQLCLKNWQAHYDDALKVYSVPGVTPQNPMRIANAYPPGELPPLDAFQQAENLISGVSVILQKPKRKRGFDKVQLKKMVAFTQELAGLGGGILDVDRKPATPETFSAIAKN